ncbi:MAG: hypothetical protein GY777_16520 [Candidatus Brocadiaceae bacterium]|nr:hypothetical protein [Candidatus Brocadiaceae bacterium]
MKKVFKQSAQRTKVVLKRSKIMLPTIVSAVGLFVVLCIYCHGSNSGDPPLSGPAATFGIILSQLIQIAGFVFMISAFAFFIPITFYLFIGKKRETLRASVHKDLKQIDPSYKEEVIDKKFINVFNDEDYTLPVLFATYICFFGWILVFFPQGPALSSPEVFGKTVLADLKGIVREIRVNSPLVSYGFLGAYFYSIQLLFRRFMQSDLKPTVYIYVTMRILISFIIVFVLSLLTMFGDDNDVKIKSEIYCAFAFFVGICPTAGISWIQKKLNRFGFKTRKLEDERSLNMIEGLTIWDEARLLEEGIENVQNLATANITNLIIHTRFNTDRLIDWIDQASLIIHIGSQITDWRKKGIRTASDFIYTYGEGSKESLVLLAEKQVIDLYHDSMQKGPNIQLIKSWWQEREC